MSTSRTCPTSVGRWRFQSHLVLAGLAFLSLLGQACRKVPADQIETVARLTADENGGLVTEARYCGVAEDFRPSFGCPGARGAKQTSANSRQARSPRANFESLPVVLPTRAKLSVALATPSNHAASFVLSMRGAGKPEILLEERLATHGTWENRQIDLSRFGGQEVSFAFSAAGVEAPTTGPETAIWGAPEVLRPTAAGPRANLLLLYVNTSDAGATGNPALEDTRWHGRLGREGATLAKTLRPSDNDAASLASLMSSEYPIVHGVPDSAWGLPRRLFTLAEVLAREGYTTAALVDDSTIALNKGLERGFDSYRLMLDGSPERRARISFESSERWLEKHAKDLFFLFLGLSSNSATGIPTETNLREQSSAIAYGIDRLLDQLERIGILDETLVVVVSRKANEQATLIEKLRTDPVLLRLPGKVPAGRRVSDLVSLVDIAPTLLRILELPERPGTSGRSLIDAIHGDPLAGHRVRFTEGGREGPRWIAARTDEGAWVWRENHPGIEHVTEDDPTRREDRSPTNLEEARALLEAYASLGRHRQLGPGPEISVEDSSP